LPAGGATRWPEFFWVVSVDRKTREMPDLGVAGDFLSELARLAIPLRHA
jgi:hypothetical protein